MNDEREERLQRFFSELEKAISTLTGIKYDKGLQKQGRLLGLGLLTDIVYKDHKCRCQAKRPYDGESLMENLINFWGNSLDNKMKKDEDLPLLECLNDYIATVWASIYDVPNFPGLIVGEYL